MTVTTAESGQDAQIAWTRQSGDGDRAETLLPGNVTAALAWPAALPWSPAAELPAASEDRGVLILALPRAAAESSALDRFLQGRSGRGAGRNGPRTVELVFLYGKGSAGGGAAHTGELASAAETCAAMYNRRPGVSARAIGV